ncbi:MAG: hypothetical protein NVV73_13505 [Cellvibrionaceae bacterium]|nr:hypothetical protein [Cellvibrionaceae bacterium]
MHSIIVEFAGIAHPGVVFQRAFAMKHAAGKLTFINHIGSAPLPRSVNQAALKIADKMRAIRTDKLTRPLQKTIFDCAVIFNVVRQNSVRGLPLPAPEVLVKEVGAVNKKENSATGKSSLSVVRKRMVC